MLRLRAFGALDLRDAEGRPLSAVLAQPKRAALLSYLAGSHPGELHRRDALLALLWPELDQEHGRKALSQALSFLRREVGAEVVVARGHDELGVDPARVWCDVVAFQEALGRRDWEGALGLYRGELLDGLHVTEAAPFVDWVDRERVRLREGAAGAAWALAHERIGKGKLVEAERMAQRALSLVATDESPVREFIVALAGAGDRGAALRFYEKFKGVLASELEVEPAPETEAVAAAVRRGEVRAGPAGPQPAAGSEGEGSQPGPPAKAGRAASPPGGDSRPWLDAWRALGPGGRVALAGGVVLTLAAVAVLTTAWLGRGPIQVAATDIVPLTHEPGVEFLPELRDRGDDVGPIRGEPAGSSSSLRGGRGQGPGGRPLAGPGLGSRLVAGRPDAEFPRVR